jgi:3-phosphoshikimate 1-carboxyvinyltransferase
MRIYRLSHPTRCVGTPEQPLHIVLNSSKSISNRALIVNALRGAEDPAEGLEKLSAAADTRTLLRLLRERPEVCNAGDGGTTFRFLAAFLALQEGCRELTGSTRMQERPVGPLVEALRQLGASVEYLKRGGYPPLRICGPVRLPAAGRARVQIDAGVSSQFISALMLIGPYLSGGLEIVLNGPPVSISYLEMTQAVMQHFGAAVYRYDDKILVEPHPYRPRPLRIEADWSAASYWYAIAALAESAHIVLEGLTDHSWQGDRMAAQLAVPFGVQTTFETLDGRPCARLRATGSEGVNENLLFFNGNDYPDLTQTFVVLCSAYGQRAAFSGLQTLPLKETNRCAALQSELSKVKVFFEPIPQEPNTYLVSGSARWDAPVRFATYGDHRMAMALAPLALLQPIDLENPEVVNKSYPQFWEHLQQAGFLIEERIEA